MRDRFFSKTRKLSNPPSWRSRKIASAVTALSLPLFLAACGSDDDSTSAAAAPQAQVATAASAGASEAAQKYDQFNIQALPEAPETDRFIVKYKENTRQRRDSGAVDARVNERTRSLGTHARHSHRLATGGDVIITDRKLTRKEAESYMQQIYADPDVEYVEPDVRLYGQMIPNDPGYSSSQFAFMKQSAYPGAMNAEEAWDIANGSGITIAELDTGVAFHADLDANVLLGTEITLGAFSGDGRDRGVTTGNCAPGWHGTHVAGTLAASTNNGIGVAGTAWAAKIVPVKVLDSCGAGSGYRSDIATGVIWASGGVVPGAPMNPNPAQVLNMSLGSAGACSPTLQDAIDGAVSRGAVVVVAAGNSNADVSTMQPANCNNVIAVAAHQSDGSAASFSNWGNRISISAPGRNIYSTLKNGRDASAADSYEWLSGTSMATPHVAGVVALMQSAAAKSLTPAEVRAILTSTARPFPISPANPMGPGMIDAAAAVTAARNMNGPVANFDFTPYISNQISSSFNFKNKSYAKSGELISSSWHFDYPIADPSLDNWEQPKWHDVGFAGVFNKSMPLYGRVYKVTLTIKDSNGLTDTITKTVSVPMPKVDDIKKGEVISNLSSDPIWTHLYKIEVPANSKNLIVKMFGGNGTAGLTISRNTLVINSNPPIDRKKYFFMECYGNYHTNDKACSLPAPSPGTYYIAVTRGPWFDIYNDASITADYDTQ